MDDALRIFLGYDPREHTGYLKARNSIERRSSKPVLVTPLTLSLVSHLIPPPIRRDGRLFDIESDAAQATEFARSRFCIPFIESEGWVLFADCDIICLGDVADLFAMADDRYAVMCVKHQQRGGDSVKMDGQLQTYYERKNWSSVVLWNCSHKAHKRLTEHRLNMWPGRDLHAFKWLEDEEIGELPHAWNYLVGIDGHEREKKLLHYTLGTPDFCPETLWAGAWHGERI